MEIMENVFYEEKRNGGYKIFKTFIVRFTCQCIVTTDQWA